MGEESSESDEEPQQTGQPYNELLQLLHANTQPNGPARKKRKVDHKGKGKRDEFQAVNSTEEESMPGNDLEDQAPSDEGENPEEIGADDVEEDGEDGILFQPVIEKPC